MEPRAALVCAGDTGINALATVRSLGRRGVPVYVAAFKGSPQIASASRYCRGYMPVEQPGDLASTLLDFGRRKALRPVLYVDNDSMMRVLAPHTRALAARFELVDPLADAERLTDKPLQVELARRCGLAVPRTWRPQSWAELAAIATPKRLIAKSLVARPGLKGLIAASAAELEEKLRPLAMPADVLVQEFVEGDDSQIYAALAYRAKSIERCFVMSARKLRQSQPGAGVMAVGQAVDVAQVREMTRRLVRAAGLRGVLCSEFKLDPTDGKYYFIEWNPRPAYFHSIGWKCGFDLPWLAWCDHVDPVQLAAQPAFEPAGHYWINVRCDLMHLARASHRIAAFRTWLPYLGRTEWAVFALDDPKPWIGAMRQLGEWIRDGFAKRAAALRAAPPAAAAAAGPSRDPRHPAPR